MVCLRATQHEEPGCNITILARRKLNFIRKICLFISAKSMDVEREEWVNRQLEDFNIRNYVENQFPTYSEYCTHLCTQKKSEQRSQKYTQVFVMF